MKTRRFTMRVDGYTRCCLTAIAVLLTVLVVGLWTGAPTAKTAAAAAPPERAPEPGESILPNSAAQRVQLIDAINGTNQRLDKLMELLQGGKVQVTVVNPENKAGDNAPTK